MKKILFVIIGPTAIGKTTLSIEIAQKINAEIISADSRQFYTELDIGVAAPSVEEMSVVNHHFVKHLSITDYYNVSRFEGEVLNFLSDYYIGNQSAVMVGGSGLYINAVCHGIDDLPDPDEKLRKSLQESIRNNELDLLKSQLKKLDPEYYKIVDKNNPNRILRALEVCLMTGQTYTSLRKKRKIDRDFEIVKIGLNRPRKELYSIIETRVDNMIESGLVKEVEGLIKFQHLNSLNTVGYKEIFKYLNGEYSLDLAIEKIKTNSRRYAKRQLTWFKRDETIQWFHPEEKEKMMTFIDGFL